MSKTIKELKDFTRRVPGDSEVVIKIGFHEYDVEAMQLVRTEDRDVVALFASIPCDLDHEPECCDG